MAMLQAVAVVGLLAVLLSSAIWLTSRTDEPRRPVVTGGRWTVGHYDVGGATRVVLRKVSEDGDIVLDEHLIATIGTADPEYDEKFLGAMTTARQRQALFESEEG